MKLISENRKTIRMQVLKKEKQHCNTNIAPK